MKFFLFAWSTAAFGWWLTALILLALGRREKISPTTSPRKSISVFKPLPPVRSEAERAAIGAAMKSFVAQLSAHDEMLIGLDANDAENWKPCLQSWRAINPAARIEMLARDVPRQCANPKVAWLEVLAPSARGELWLWSDADVTAPSGLLEAMSAQLAAGAGNAVTAPYAVQRLPSAKGALDALFVNAEFLPGALLLGAMGKQDFAYGAATLFSAEIFRARGDWQKLGAALADDHKLGELLQPVILGNQLVSTFTAPTSWAAAWQHYYRWQKTIRWCRPGGFAALVMLMPGIGWVAGTLIFGGNFFLTGLTAVFTGEVAVGFFACLLAGCRLPLTAWPVVLCWPVCRVLAWLLVWLPLPVLWSGRKRAWFSPQQN